MTADVEHWIWLALAFPAGSPKPCRLAETLGGAKAVFEADKKTLEEAGATTVHDLEALRPHDLAPAQRIVAHCMARGYQICTFADADYPALLREIHAPPAVLYVNGRLPEADALGIAMVGTRRATGYGLAAAERLSVGLAREGAAVVSGLAAGIDTASHRGAIKGGGKTYAVLGCGLDTVYPASNRGLYRSVSQNGGVLSEFPPAEKPDRHHFPIRNRIIAGLSAGTVVVEAGRRSGALITAGQALEMGRDVFAVPGSIFSPLSEGANGLLKDGAKPICGVEDILEEYPAFFSHTIPEKEAAQTGPFLKEDPPPEIPPAAPGPAVLAKGLDETQRAVLACLDSAPRHVDEVAVRANLPPARVLSVLTMLEIEGLVRSEPGSRFHLV